MIFVLCLLLRFSVRRVFRVYIHTEKDFDDLSRLVRKTNVKRVLIPPTPKCESPCWLSNKCGCLHPNDPHSSPSSSACCHYFSSTLLFPFWLFLFSYWIFGYLLNWYTSLVFAILLCPLIIACCSKCVPSKWIGPTYYDFQVRCFTYYPIDHTALKDSMVRNWTSQNALTHPRFPTYVIDDFQQLYDRQIRNAELIILRDRVRRGEMIQSPNQMNFIPIGGVGIGGMGMGVPMPLAMPIGSQGQQSQPGQSMGMGNQAPPPPYTVAVSGSGGAQHYDGNHLVAPQIVVVSYNNNNNNSNNPYQFPSPSAPPMSSSSSSSSPSSSSGNEMRNPLLGKEERERMDYFSAEKGGRGEGQ